MESNNTNLYSYNPQCLCMVFLVSNDDARCVERDFGEYKNVLGGKYIPMPMAIFSLFRSLFPLAYWRPPRAKI